MTNTILAFDNEDADLGEFFSECLEDLIQYFNAIEQKIEIIDGQRINSVVIEAVLEKLDSFVFLAYSHGSDKELLANNSPYVSEDNVSLFNNSLFYTCSCHTGKILAQNLIDGGCSCYIGYKDKFSIWDFNRPPFIECANFGIKQFFQGVDTDEILIRMQEKYNEHIDNYNNDAFGAAILLSNRRALKPIGKNIRINDLNSST